MRFTSPIVAVAGLAAIVPSVLATIKVIGPSANSYWVQNASNLITWTADSGDPNPVTITITNTNSSFLNGDFPIEEGVNVHNKSVTVTNVTLVVHSRYLVNFVNPKNLSQVYAQSEEFDVKAPGTPQASQATSAPSATGTSPAGNATASGTSASPKNATSASTQLFDGSLMTLAPMLGISALMSVAGALGTL